MGTLKSALNMKKILLALLVLASIAGRADGQVLIALLFGDKLQTETFEFGVRVGANGANFTTLDGVSLKPGLAFGMYGTKFLSDRFAIQPEASFLAPRGAQDMPRRLSDDIDIDSLLTSTSTTRSLAYVEIPILVKYYLTYNISVGVGPQVGWLRSADDKATEILNNGDEITHTKDIKSDLSTWDYGIAFGVDYRLGLRRLHFTARGYYGLGDTIKDNPIDAVRNVGFNISVGIPIGSYDPEDFDE